MDDRADFRNIVDDDGFDGSGMCRGYRGLSRKVTCTGQMTRQEGYCTVRELGCAATPLTTWVSNHLVSNPIQGLLLRTPV